MYRYFISGKKTHKLKIPSFYIEVDEDTYEKFKLLPEPIPDDPKVTLGAYNPDAM